MSLIDQKRLEHWSERLVDISRGAAEKILEIYSEEDFGIELKGDDSPLTRADKASHELIVKELMALAPDIPIISEESKQLPYAVRSCWKTYWLVDPLDGTKEFIKRNGEFTVNIALVHENRPILGVVYVPVSATGYVGISGKGAFRLDAAGESTKLEVRTADLNGLTAVGSRSHMTSEVEQYCQKLSVNEIQSIGSSLKLCLVAEGCADIYPRLGPTSEWDTAAAQCVVEQAGGKVVTTNGEPLAYNTKESFLNPHFLVYGDSKIDWLSYLS